MEPYLIGYFAKRTRLNNPDWLDVAHVREICTATFCTSIEPEPWIGSAHTNAASVFDDEDQAWSTIAETSRARFQMYAFRLFPIAFREGDGDEVALPLPQLAVKPLPVDFQSLGYDAVSCWPYPECWFEPIGCEWFGCSPLSCNGRAEVISVNEYCLMNSWKQAFHVAKRFSRSQVETGLYFVVEVLRRA